jgi:hypothetical protein
MSPDTHDYLYLLRARHAEEAQTFKSWCLDRLGSLHLPSDGSISRLVVNIAEPEPEELELYSDSKDPRPPYDVVLQLSCRADFAQEAQRLARWEDRALCHPYRVTRTVIRDAGRVADGRPSNGIKMIHPLHFHADMPDSAVRRSWANHARLAVKVHVGASRYCQNWIEDHLDGDAPGYRGLSELHFASRKELIEGYFDSPRGREEIAQDIAHFIVGRPPRVFTREHILRV